MSEEPETTTTSAAAPSKKDDEKADNGNAEGGGGGGGGENGDKRKGKKSYPRDETPVEELFDLSQPIPRVERPDKDAFDKELAEITEAVDALKEERRKIQEKVDGAMADPESKDQKQEAHGKMNAFKAEKNALIEQKRALRAEMDQSKTKTDKLIKEKKDARSNVKYNSVQEIDEALKALQRKQETTTMSLTEEKKLIKEMDALRASKKFVADLKDKDASIDDIKEQKKTIQQRMDAKNKEIDALSKQMDEVAKVIKAISEKESTKRNSLQDLFQERKAVGDKMQEKLKARDALRDEFRTKNNDFYNFQRAIRAQKKMQYEAEKEEREKERAEWEAKIAAEEAKKIPYEEEQALCDYLADYLERTYLTSKGDKSDEQKKEDVVAVKDDPFASFKPVKKNDDEIFFGKGKGKKKRDRSNKTQHSITAGPFILSVDTFEQFGLLMLDPPTKIEEVEASVKELRAKKEWYKQQERGSVPTAQEIRKTNEKAANKLRQQALAEQAASDTGAKKKGGNFNLSSDDFAPLGAGTSSTAASSSWGQKPAAEAQQAA